MIEMKSVVYGYVKYEFLLFLFFKIFALTDNFHGRFHFLTYATPY